MADVSIITGQNFDVLLDKLLQKYGETIEMPLDDPNAQSI